METKTKIAIAVATAAVAGYVGIQTYRFIQDEKKRSIERAEEKTARQQKETVQEETASTPETVVQDVQTVSQPESSIEETQSGPTFDDQMMDHLKALYQKAYQNVFDRAHSIRITELYQGLSDFELDVDLTNPEEVCEAAKALVNTQSGEFIELVCQEHYRLLTKDM